MSDRAIRLSDVTVAYGSHPAVRRVSGVFAPGSSDRDCRPERRR